MKKLVLLSCILTLITSLSTAQVLLIPSNSVWKYKDDGSDQGTAWYGTTFNDASWSAGPAEFGYGDNDEATLVNACGTVVAAPSCSNKYITTYFRQTFNVASATSFTSYLVNLRRDDGIVLYLNGVEVYRENMPAGTITYTTPASTACSDDGATILSPTIPASLIVTGTNVIAAEIHQNVGTSSDLSFILSLYGNTSTVSTQFSGGNVVVLQAGNGTSALSSTATPIFLREFSPNGDILYTYTVPVTSNTLTMSGSATSEGGLTLSADKTRLILVGYNAAVGTTGIAATTSTVANRMVAAVTATGGITYTGTNTYFSANNIRCGTSDGQGNFWAAGATSGLCYMGTVSAAAITQTTSTNLRYVQIFNNELYFSTSSGTSGIYKVGSGLPVTAGQTTSLIINTSTVGTSPVPNGFYFNPAMTICYIADDRTIANGGGIQKWVNSAGTWTLAYTFSTSIALSTSGARGVIADFSGANPIIYGTSAEGSVNRLFKIIDGGSVASSTISTLATAGSNTIFRGVAFSPTLSSCSAVSISSVSSNTAVCSTQSLDLNVTAGGTAPFTYTWSGPGVLNSYSISNPALANPVSGNYTVNVGNGCGTASAVISVSVNSTPTLAASAATICAGNSETLAVSGANTYTWNTASNSNSIVVSPGVTTIYTVSGTSAQGCVASTTVDLTVNSLPTLSVNSGTICSGGQTTLSASGASSYTWNTSSNSSSIVVNPASTTNYTVVGSDANSCVNSATTSVNVVSSPSISVSSGSICAGQTGTLTATGAMSYTWSNAATGFSITDSPTSTTVYTVTGDAAGCQASASGTITVHALPILNVSSATICSGGTATLSGSGAATYTWNNGSNASLISVTPSVTTGYTLSGTSLEGCVNFTSTQVMVNASPTISVNSETICIGTTATLTASGATTYTWNTSSNTSSIVVTPTSTAIYTITGTSNSCNGNNTTTVTVNPLPIINAPASNICSGGSSTLTASGAVSYTWSTGSNSPSITASPTINTTYTVSGTSSDGCVNSTTTSITVSSSPSIAVTSVSVCTGSQATLVASGVNTYTWNTGANTSSIVITPTSSAVYTVSGNASGCAVVVSNTLNLTLNPLPTVTVNSATVCAGTAATLTASGASTYSWDVGGTSTSINPSPMVTTTYSVNGTSALGCINSASAIVVVNPLPTISVNTATICSGSSATLIANGATSYVWNTSSTSNSIVVTPTTNLNYTVTGFASGCISTSVTNVLVNALPYVSATSTTICAGNSATLTAGGADTYSWSSGSISANAIVNPSTTLIYTVTGTSSLNCSNTATAQVLVSALPNLTINSVTICSGATATLSVSGASSYSWNTGGSSSSITLSPSVTTTYTVNGTSSLSCVSNATTQVVVNPNPSITVNTATICFGGQATLNAIGASTYTWNTSSNSASIVVTPTATSVYTITGTSNSCNGNNTTTVTVNPLPVINAPASNICSGGSSTLIASGAASYTWSTGSNSPSITASPTINTTYTVSGSSSDGCVNSTTTSITISSSPSIAVTSVSVCAGNQTTLVASGVNTYTWNTGANTSSIVITPTSSAIYTVSGNASGCAVVVSNTLNLTLNPLPTVTVNSATVCAGTSATLTASGASTYSWNTGATTTSIVASPSVNSIYTVTGTSGLGCVTAGTTQVIASPNPSLTVNSPTICSGSQATLTVSGANTYSWSTGATNSLIVVSPTASTSYSVMGIALGCSTSIGAGVSVNNSPTVTVSSATICSGGSATLTAGGASTYSWSNNFSTTNISVSPTITTGYTVTGVSVQGCSNTAIAQLVVNNQPTLTINSTSVCSGNSATLAVSGASTYVWNTSATGATIATAPLTIATIYTVTGTSSLNCTATGTTQVNVTANPTVTVNSASICSGISATLTATGASSYSWNTGSTAASVVVTPGSSINYTVTGTASGCNNTATTSVNVNALPSISVNSLSICSGGNGTLTASGANTYSWSTASTSPSIAVNPTLTTNYTVTGTSTAGCVGSATTAVIVTSSPAISVNSSVVCAGSSATLVASGVSTYTWNNGSNSNTIIVTPATTTVYTISGNASGCAVTASSTASVTVNALPVIVAASTSVCAGNTATLTASGANTYTWSTGSNGNSITVSSATNTFYIVAGTQNGCVNTATANLTVNALPNVTINSSTAVCAGSTATLIASGAAGYIWNTGFNGASYTISPGTTSTYTVTGSSAQGCTNSAVVTVTVNSLPSVSLNIPASTLCVSDNSVTLTGMPSGGTYSGTAVNANSFNPVLAGVGVYTLTYSYMDANACSGTDTRVVTVDACNGLLEKSTSSAISIYPNPALTELWVRNENFAADYTIQIIDVNGKQVYSEVSGEEINSLSINTLANGIYFVRITENNKQTNLKFIKN